jgi:hypothetical protein
MSSLGAMSKLFILLLEGERILHKVGGILFRISDHDIIWDTVHVGARVVPLCGVMRKVMAIMALWLFHIRGHFDPAYKFFEVS